MSDSSFSKIVILDFGSQYTQVIARRIRECQVYSQIVRFDIPAAELKAMGAHGLIFSGGPASVYAEGAPSVGAELFDIDHGEQHKRLAMIDSIRGRPRSARRAEAPRGRAGSPRCAPRAPRPPRSAAAPAPHAGR